MSVQRSTLIFAWILLLPAVLYVTVIVAYPLVDTFILSFTDASLKKTTNWVGWVNYEKIFNATFAEVIMRTFVWTFFSVSIKMIIGVFGASMLNAAVPGRALFRVLTMPPWIVPMAIGIFMWGWMYNGHVRPDFRPVAALRLHRWAGRLSRAGFDEPSWATIITDVWIGVPLVTLYMLAAMQSIPQDLYEAAWTDGAGRFYRFRRITLPLLIPSLITMSMLSLIATFNSFDIISILTRGGPSGETTTMIIDTYHTAIGSKKYGEGAARAVLICIFLSIFCLAYFRVTSRLSSGDNR